MILNELEIQSPSMHYAMTVLGCMLLRRISFHSVMGLHVSGVGLSQQCQRSVLDCWIIADREIFHIIAFQLFSKISDTIEQLGPMGCKNI